ncbi:spherulation-specific family 4 protein [Acidovorax sp. NCPPB 4044]|uniref:spherulation-specific family 4 protein n=1 Tax=Acidovorax sp. NCPPB 4044 TaxID=2940490 RepID=UPI00230323E8|nr:spherulation-specific family 4 protein [Acidovorax sp. NCPPB 4044]MDA8519539.1 spherulation-specific family 4 protein [Acidovorax sp. NCPPB 4044]
MDQTIHPSMRRTLQCCALSTLWLLAGCGGGGSGSTDAGGAAKAAADAPAAAAPALAFTAPAEGDVFDLGTALPVSVAVPSLSDGAAVVFSAGSGSFVPAAATVEGGTASATFTATTPGPQALAASVSVQGVADVAASASRTLYARPAPAPLEVLVPAYFYPSSDSPWGALSAGTRAYPSVAVTAVLNPNNGVFTRANPEFTAAATTFVQSGGKLLGYVYTRYGSRSASTVKRNIDSYLSLYGRGLIGGIFIDEMSTEAKRLAYYRDLYDYIKGKDASLRVVGNPGTLSNAAYLDAADTLVNFENRAKEFAGYDPRASGGWLYRTANTRQSALLHNAPDCATMQQAVRTAATARYNTGSLYVTDDSFNPDTGEGDPWDTLPGYWLRFLGTVDAVNRGADLPAC